MHYKTLSLGLVGAVWKSCEDIKHELLYACRHASTNNLGFSAQLNSFCKAILHAASTDLGYQDLRWRGPSRSRLDPVHPACKRIHRGSGTGAGTSSSSSSSLSSSSNAPPALFWTPFGLGLWRPICRPCPGGRPTPWKSGRSIPRASTPVLRFDHVEAVLCPAQPIASIMYMQQRSLN